MNPPVDSLDHHERVLFDLVSTPSVSGSEAAAAEVFVQHALSLGMQAEIDAAGNALGHSGPQDASTHIVLLGHIDTVPGDLPVFIRDGALHGRGSVDAKGPLAAMLVAASLVSLPKNVRVTVAGAVGEEVAGSPGARFLARQYRPHACIIGEPSGWDGVTLGYKGCMTITAECERANTHSAGPEGSAADTLMAWWMDVLGHADRLNTGRAGIFDQLQSTIRHIGAGEDGVRQHAKLTAGFRLPPGLDPQELFAELTKGAGSDIRFTQTGAEIAVISDRNDEVARAISMAIRAAGTQPRPKRKTGTADFNVVAPVWQCPIAAYGPGDSSLDHTPHEHLVLADYRRSIGVLRDAISTLATSRTTDPSELQLHPSP